MTMANIVMLFEVPLKPTDGRKLKQKIRLQQISFTSMCIKNPAKTGLIISNPHLKKLINGQQNLKSQLKANSLING